MSVSFEAGFFIANRQRLKTLFAGTAPIVLTANAMLQMATTEPYPFKQDSSFWYLAGIDEPEVLLVIDKDKEYLILPERSDYLDIFTGRQLVGQLTKQSGIPEVLDYKDGIKRLKSKLRRSKHVATLSAPANYIDVYGMYSNPARSKLIEKLKKLNPDLELLDLRPHLAQLRMVKQESELQVIKQAIKITESTIQKISKHGWKKFNSTFDIETDILSLFRNKGADGAAFDSVVAAGPDACVIHSRPNKSILPRKGTMILDIGATVNNYCADISRTFFLTEPTKRQQKVYESVINVYEFAFGLLKPGIIIRDYEQQVEQFMGEKLRELGLIKSIEHSTVRKYFPHATSHHLGIDVHDVADYDKPLQAGMVLTVEPGIYIPEETIGIRVEDDVLITTKGAKVLNSKALMTPW